MSSAGLSIAIKADTTGLAQGFAAAVAQTRAFAASVNAAGAQMANVFSSAGNASRAQTAASRAAAEAMRAQCEQEVSFERNAAAQIAQIRRSDLATSVALARQSLDAKKQELDEEVEAHKITVQQKYDVLARLTSQEEALNEQALRDDEHAQDASLAQRVEDINKIRELHSQLDLDLAALNREQTRDAQEENQKQLQSWQSVVGEIANAESGLVGDILSKRQGLAVDLGQIGLQLLESEIGNDLKYYTTHLLYNALGLQSDQTTAQGGLLVHLLGETQKTSATAAGVTARMAATSAGAAAGKAAQTAANSSTIASDAGTAAAGVYSSAAQIPLIGWLIAPIAAAAAFAGVMAFNSFDKGAWELPHDTIARVHKGETILNASEASDFRSIISGAGRGFPAGAAGDTINHFHFSPALTGTIPKNAMEELSNAQDAFAGLIQGMVRNGRLKF